MSGDELDPERRLRIATLLQALQAASAQKPIDDTQIALANLVAQFCMGSFPDDPDALFLNFQQVMVEIWQRYRKQARQGTVPTGVVVN